MPKQPNFKVSSNGERTNSEKSNPTSMKKIPVHLQWILHAHIYMAEEMDPTFASSRGWQQNFAVQVSSQSNGSYPYRLSMLSAATTNTII